MALVEFCGFPGSGKTTVGAQLVRCLRASGDAVIDRIEADEDLESRYVGRTPFGTAAEAVRYGVSRPDWARAVGAVVWRSRSRQTVRSMVRIQNQLRTSMALARGRQLILDEWFVHQAWLATIDSKRVTVPDVQQVLRGMSEDLSGIRRVLVRLEAPPAVAASRVLSRTAVTSFDRFSQVELEHVLSDAARSLDALCQTSSETATFLRFDTSVLTPAQIVEELLPHVRELR